MKIFSMIFTALFFLSFVNVSYAEPYYTITNKSDDTVDICIDDITSDDTSLKVSLKSYNYFKLQSNECLKLTEHLFRTHQVVVCQHPDDEQRLIPAGNYEITATGILWWKYFHATHVSQLNISTDCIGAEQSRQKFNTR